MLRGASIAGVLLVIVVGLAAGWWIYWRPPALPPHIASANGRLEMTRLDIAVKFPGRIISLPFQEGDSVTAGTVLARQDTAEVETRLAGARAQRERALGSIARAAAEAEAHRGGERLARLELTQAERMQAQSLVSDVEVQRRAIALGTEHAGVSAAKSAAGEARAALGQAESEVASLNVLLDEATIRAPVSGRIEYRIVEQGAVLPAGGRIASLLDTNDVYMTIFLPADSAGSLKFGDEARIALDAYPGSLLTATVSFISPEAQFTPKYVETASEREKLVYRVKLRLPRDTARQYDGTLKAGMTGNGYVRTDSAKPWPAELLLRPLAQRSP